jgi:hypothetical protein
MTKSTRWAGISIAALFLAIGAALSATPAHGQDQAWFITRAVYGFRSQQTNVTDLVRDLISRGGVNGRIAVNNQTMGGDPAVGRDKTLRIFARNRANEEHEFDFAEGSFVPAEMFAVSDRDSEHHDGWDRARGPDESDRRDRDDRDSYRDSAGRQQLQILWAFYGVQRQSANVTGLLQGMIDRGRLAVPVNNRSMGGDPAVGANKMLIVIYRYNGAEQAAAVGEGGVLTIP